jgi:hypothetical protein
MERNRFMALIRTCIGCGQEDDHPRHDIVNVDGSVSSWHHDCHAYVTGHPVSKAVADTGLKGDELRDYIIKNDPGGEVLRRQAEASDSNGQASATASADGQQVSAEVNVNGTGGAA